MTRPFVESYIKRYLHEGSMDDYIETSHPNFDLLVVHTPSELYKMIFAVKDNRVIKVSYSGFASLETLIKEIDNAL